MFMLIHSWSLSDVTFFENIFPMKNLHSMSTLLENVIADTTHEPSENFVHAEHTLELVHEEIDGEAPRRSKRQRTIKSFGDDFTVYLMDGTPKTIAKVFASPDEDDSKEVCIEMGSIFLMKHGSWLINHMVANPLVASGCSKRRLDLMVLLISTRQGLWLRVIPRKKVKVSLTLIHLLLD
jgi:hypothetical protein